MAEALGQLRRELRRRGVRLTPRRDCIVSLIEGSHTALTADALLRAGKARFPAMNKTTVYRTIALLKDHELIDELDLLHHEARAHYYECVPDQQELHLVCLSCGQVIDAESVAWETLKKEVEQQHGFAVTTARIEMGGRCRKCR